MKWVTLLSILALAVVYAGIAMFGLVMSAFCFDSGQSAAAWECFSGINLAFILPGLICVIVGLVLFFMRRYKTAIIVAAVPAGLALVGYVVLFVATAMYRP